MSYIHSSPHFRVLSQDPIINHDFEEKIEEDQHGQQEKSPPEEFICPITLQVMTKPLTTRWNLTFERKAILEWIEKYETCPLTRQSLRPGDLIPNKKLEHKIKFWKQAAAAKNLCCDDDIQISKIELLPKQNAMSSQYELDCKSDYSDDDDDDEDDDNMLKKNGKFVAVLPLDKEERAQFSGRYTSSHVTLTSIAAATQQQQQQQQQPPDVEVISDDGDTTEDDDALEIDDNNDEFYAAPVSAFWKTIDPQAQYAREPGKCHRVFLQRMLAAANMDE